MNPQVVVSHPTRQHSPHLAFALQEAEMLSRYFTSFWFKPEKPFFRMADSLPLVGSRIEKAFRKRYYAPLNANLVTQFPRFEMESQGLRLISEALFARRVYSVNDRFDLQVSKKLRHMHFDILVGYETSSRHCINLCKSMGKTSILDLGQVHFNRHSQLKDAGFDPMFGDRKLEQKVNAVKQQELESADLIFVPSELSRMSVLDAGISSKKIRLIPYGYDPIVYSPKESYRGAGPLELLFIGAITRRKGIETLLNALKKLNRGDIRLTLVGGMADAARLLSSLEIQITHIPYTHAENLSRILHDADVFVLPSLLDSFGLVVLEAIGTGTPVIVSDRTGAADIVRSGIDGFVVPAMDTAHLQEAILHFYENRADIERFGRNAAKQASQYTWDEYRSRVRETIRELFAVPA